MSNEVTPQGVMKAFAKTRAYLPISAMLQCHELAAQLGVEMVLLKYEGSLPSGSFKVRGATNFALNTPRGTKLLTHSSGNWASASAYACRKLGHQVVVYMNPKASEFKRNNALQFGAEIRDIEGQPDEMTMIVTQAAQSEGGVFVSPYDHQLIIEGHAGCGVEISNQCKAFGVTPNDVLVQVSGGGLSAGVAFAIKNAFPKCQITCVEPTGCDDFGQSLLKGERVSIAKPRRSIADGLLANQVGVNNWPVLRNNVNAALTVKDEDIKIAMRFLFEKHGIITEPSGAITVAAALNGSFRASGKECVVFVLSGRNIENKAFLKMIATKSAAPKNKVAKK